MRRKNLTIEIVTPQFTRERGAPAPAPPPSDRESWEDLRKMSKPLLCGLGLRPWNDPNDPEDRAEDKALFDGKTLMLLPGEWYPHVPEGFELVSISGKRALFTAGVTDADIRFGCLAYGLLVGEYEKPRVEVIGTIPRKQG